MKKPKSRTFGMIKREAKIVTDDAGNPALILGGEVRDLARRYEDQGYTKRVLAGPGMSIKTLEIDFLFEKDLEPTMSYRFHFILETTAGPVRLNSTLEAEAEAVLRPLILGPPAN